VNLWGLPVVALGIFVVALGILGTYREAWTMVTGHTIGLGTGASVAGAHTTLTPPASPSPGSVQLI
jgi:hypothetical protein